MSKAAAIFLFGFLPGAAVAFLTLIAGVLLAPPHYVARGAFNINWDRMPDVANDPEAKEVRLKWRSSIIERITKEQPVSEIADALAKRGNQNVQANEKKLNRWLHLSVVQVDNDNDRFIVEVRDNDEKWALAAVDCVLEQNITSLSWEAKVGSGMATLRSGSTISDIEARKAELRSELSQRLHQEKDSYERNRRCDEIKQELASLEGDHAIAGLNAFANFAMGLFGEPVTMVEKPTVKKLGRKYILSVTGCAAVAGIFAGLLSFIGYKIACGLFGPKPPILLPTAKVPPVLQ